MAHCLYVFFPHTGGIDYVLLGAEAFYSYVAFLCALLPLGSAFEAVKGSQSARLEKTRTMDHAQSPHNLLLEAGLWAICNFLHMALVLRFVRYGNNPVYEA